VYLGEHSLEQLLICVLGLLENILLDLGQILEGGQAFLQLENDTTRIFMSLVLGKSEAGPAFLVVGFEGDPFLTETILGQALHFGDLVDASLEFLNEFLICFLGAFDRALGHFPILHVSIQDSRLFMEGLEAGFPFLPCLVALDLES